MCIFNDKGVKKFLTPNQPYYGIRYFYVRKGKLRSPIKNNVWRDFSLIANAPPLIKVPWADWRGGFIPPTGIYVMGKATSNVLEFYDKSTVVAIVRCFGTVVEHRRPQGIRAEYAEVVSLWKFENRKLRVPRHIVVHNIPVQTIQAEFNSKRKTEIVNFGGVTEAMGVELKQWRNTAK